MTTNLKNQVVKATKRLRRAVQNRARQPFPTPILTPPIQWTILEAETSQHFRGNWTHSLATPVFGQILKVLDLNGNNDFKHNNVTAFGSLKPVFNEHPNTISFEKEE